MTQRLLIIDDEPDLRQCLVDLFHMHGVEAVAAASGAEAVRLVRDARFELVLTDLRMPGMDGLETIRALRDVDPALRFIMMTAYTSDEVAAQCLQLGARQLRKPFSFEDVLDMVGDLGHRPR